MNLDFDFMTIEGFRSFAHGEHTLDFERLGAGLHFMRGRNKVESRLGSNGAGKSSVWGALCWCLYGRTPEGLRNPDIVPWNDGGAASVTVLANAVPIQREAKTNGLRIDGVPASQEQLDKLLGLTYSVFTNTILLGQGQPLFFDRQPRDKMELLSTVLELDRWEQRSALAKQITEELRFEAKKWEGELEATKSVLEQMGDLIVSAKANSLKWQQTNNVAIKENADKLDDAKRLLEAAETAAGSHEVELDGLKLKCKEIRADRDKVDEQLQEAKLTWHKAETELRMLSEQIRQLEKQLEEMGSSDTCPRCGQSIKGTALAKHKKQVLSDIERAEAVINKGVPKEIATAVKKLNDQRYKLSQQLITVAEQISKIDAETELRTRRRAEARASFQALEKRQEELEKATNPYKAQVADLQARRKKTAKEYEALQVDLEKRARRIERTEYWVKGFKEVRLQVIDDVLQELELVTNSMLEEVGLADWKVRYETARETKSGTLQQGLTVLIDSPFNDKPVKWESWSGGEGQRLRLTGALALSEVLLSHAGVTCNLEILDEPTTHLSQRGVDELVDMLAERAEQLDKTIILTDHMAVESSRFTSVITVEKDEHGSRFV